MTTKNLGRRMLSFTLCLVMILSLLPTFALAEGETAAAKIGDASYATLDEALAAVKKGDTVEIIAAGEYTVESLPGTDYTIDAKVDGVVFNHTAKYGSYLTSANCGITLKNITWNVGTAEYQYFRGAKLVNCTINGRLCFMEGSSAENTVFNQNASGGDYNLWAYGSCSFDGCTFNNSVKGKFINVYNEGSDLSTVTVKNCKFVNAGSASKAALNIKETSTGKLLSFNVIVDNCTTEGAFPKATTDDGGKLFVMSPLVQIDDRSDASIEAEKVTVTSAEKQIYPDKVCVAKIGDTEYSNLNKALNDAVKAGTDTTVEIIADVDLTGKTWTPVTVTNCGVITVEGNDHTITGLSDMLFDKAWAGKTGLVINDLTIKDSNIVNDENDDKGDVGVGAFVGYPEASEAITLNNCHLVDSTVSGGHWTGGLVGACAGWNKASDGPVFTTLTIKDCSVEGSKIVGKGSAGGFIGHATQNAATKVIIENCTADGNSVTGEKVAKTGKLIGTIGAAGTAKAFNGEIGGVYLDAEESNTTTGLSGDIDIVGRIGSNGGAMTVTGGSYSSDPTVTSDNSIGTLAVVEGYVIVESEGVYYVLPDYVAQIGENKYETLAEAVAAAKSGDTITLLQDCSGNGIQIPSGSDLTIDFNGFTYTIDGESVGSTGTKTSAFQLLKDSDITFKNGTLTSSTAKLLIQNYANLTLDNMVLDGSELAGTAPYPYTLSTNNGETLIKDTTIIGKDSGNAFDVCSFSPYTANTVTVEGDSVIEGNIELSSSNEADQKLVLNGGDFSKAAIVIADGGDNVVATKAEDVVFTDIPEGYVWNCQNTLVKGIAHNLEKIEAKDADCTLVGNTEYYTCSDCGKYFADENASKEISANSWTIYPAGHDMETTVVKVTCDKAGYTTHTCKTCGYSYISDLVQPEGHKYASEVTKEPSCTAEGEVTFTCSECKDSYTEAIAKLDHEYEVTTVEAGCESIGYTTHSCKNCDFSYVSEIVQAKGHTIVTDPAKEATYSENGLTEGSHCSECGMVIVEQETTSMKKLDKPVITRIANGATGIILKWDAVDGAEGYKIYCKTGTGAWKLAKTITDGSTTKWIDTNCTSGLKYQYKMVATAGDNVSAYSAVKTKCYLARPVIDIHNTADSIVIEWEAVGGADGYKLYRRTDNGEWTLFKTIRDASATSWTDTNRNNGTKYQYKVSAFKTVDGVTYASAASAVKTRHFLTRPELVSVTNVATNKVKATWTKNAEGLGYQLEYKLGDTKTVMKIADPDTLTKTISKLTAGDTYRIRVRAYYTTSGGSNYYSLWTNYKSVKITK